MKVKILCLGNEFIEEDSFAKKISSELKKDNHDIIDIKDSFQLMEELNKTNDFIILDVVENIKDVQILSISDLKNIKIMTTHDFDAGFILKLFEGKNIKIIGLPIKEDVDIIREKIKKFI